MPETNRTPPPQPVMVPRAELDTLIGALLRDHGHGFSPSGQACPQGANPQNPYPAGRCTCWRAAISAWVGSTPPFSLAVPVAPDEPQVLIDLRAQRLIIELRSATKSGFDYRDELLTAYEKRLGDLTLRVNTHDALDQRLLLLDQRLNGRDLQVTAIDHYLDNLEARVAGIHERVQAIDREQDTQVPDGSKLA